jgi:hypothetical protein
MSAIKKESSPDKYDLFIQKIDHFQSLVEEKKALQEKIAKMRLDFEEKMIPLENELAAIVKKLELNLSKLEGGVVEKPGFAKYGRGQLGASIKNLLRSKPEKAFKLREIADVLQTKGTAVSLWFNKYGNTDPEIERIPVGEGGKRFVYKIKR